MFIRVEPTSHILGTSNKVNDRDSKGSMGGLKICNSVGDLDRTEIVLFGLSWVLEIEKFKRSLQL